MTDETRKTISRIGGQVADLYGTPSAYYTYKGARYKFLDYIRVKNLTTRVWDVHVLYQDDQDNKFSREVEEFYARFKEEK